jgi:hypothetical protein
MCFRKSPTHLNPIDLLSSSLVMVMILGVAEFMLAEAGGFTIGDDSVKVLKLDGDGFACLSDCANLATVVN